MLGNEGRPGNKGADNYSEVLGALSLLFFQILFFSMLNKV